MWRPVVLLTVAVVGVTSSPVTRQVGASADIIFTTVDNVEDTQPDPNNQLTEIITEAEIVEREALPTGAPTGSEGAEASIVNTEVPIEVITDDVDLTTETPTEVIVVDVDPTTETPTDIEASVAISDNPIVVKADEVDLTTVTPTDIEASVASTDNPTETQTDIEVSIASTDNPTVTQTDIEASIASTKVPIEDIAADVDLTTETPTEVRNPSGESQGAVGSIKVSVNGEAYQDFNKDQVRDTENEDYWKKMNTNNPENNNDEPQTVEEKFEEVAEKYGLAPAVPSEDVEEEIEIVEPKPQTQLAVNLDDTQDADATNEPSSLTDRVARFVGKYL